MYQETDLSSTTNEDSSSCAMVRQWRTKSAQDYIQTTWWYIRCICNRNRWWRYQSSFHTVHTVFEVVTITLTRGFAGRYMLQSSQSEGISCKQWYGMAPEIKSCREILRAYSLLNNSLQEANGVLAARCFITATVRPGLKTLRHEPHVGYVKFDELCTWHLGRNETAEIYDNYVVHEAFEDQSQHLNGREGTHRILMSEIESSRIQTLKDKIGLINIRVQEQKIRTWTRMILRCVSSEKINWIASQGGKLLLWMQAQVISLLLDVLHLLFTTCQTMGGITAQDWLTNTTIPRFKSSYSL